MEMKGVKERQKNVIEEKRLYITGNIRHELINDRLKVDGILA